MTENLENNNETEVSHPIPEMNPALFTEEITELDQSHTIKSEVSQDIVNDTTLSTHTTIYRCKNRRLKVKIDIIQTLDERYTPVIRSVGQAWLDDKQVDISVDSYGKFTHQPKFPFNHPFVQDEEKRVVDIPRDFNQKVNLQAIDYMRDLRAIRRECINRINAEFELESQWIIPDVDTFNAKGTLHTDEGDYTVFNRGGDRHLNWDLLNPQEVDEELMPVIMTAIQEISIFDEDWLESMKFNPPEEPTGMYPVCQAESCSNPAVNSIPDIDTSTHDELKCCREHFFDCQRTKPIDVSESANPNWTPEELTYWCPDCQIELSHQSILKDPACTQCRTNANPIPIRPRGDDKYEE